MAAADVAPPAAAASDTGAVPQEPVEEATWAPAPPGSQRYDLTPQLSRFLDRHLILPLLDYLADCEVYDDNDLARTKLEILQKTSMVDFAISVFKELNDTETVPPDMLAKREQVVGQLSKLRDETQDVLSLFRDASIVERLSQDKQFNLRFLQENHGLKPEKIPVLYEYARLQFDCGNYLGAAELLYHFRILSMDQDKNLSALWGKFACEILLQNWEAALEDLTTLRQTIENRQSVMQPLHVLQQRSWLLHWSLFLFWSPDVPNRHDQLIEMFTQPSYRHALQTTSPHLLRYLTAAVIITRRKRETLKELVTMIQQESETFRDPIVEFLDCLYVQFDFDGAQQKLRDCQQVFAIDSFLQPFREDFLESARLFVFETYCKIHRKIDLRMLSERLDMGQDEAERWIVNLIRQAHLDATIDSAENTVVMNQAPVNLYQQVIERTKALTLRTSLLLTNIERRDAAIRDQRAGGEFRGEFRGGRGGGRGRGGRGRGSSNFRRDYGQQQRQQQQASGEGAAAAAAPARTETADA